MRKLEVGEICELAGCSNPAKYLIFNRETRAVQACCEAHYDLVEQDSPEHVVSCRNCGCWMGVN